MCQQSEFIHKKNIKKKFCIIKKFVNLHIFKNEIKDIEK